ncbi:23S rRNA (pseudouridine(1915)-N(3))-methyltransferase RlmH [Psychroflexus salis]|uniref:Ribosomal RNA large subunit methyltransferase H n=1 Tax=Psychroflexus salis TaxID=1526574 RepID=A0A916ZR24_9FLAO|nr:23S rRNA (pseudouridine(1915)-N(3))-methyltransferase RlmH [Psychroflexus salis]GGE10191.1 ribosomal RNA large subunit methyltransferase H [Psychroflexus salis]
MTITLICIGKTNDKALKTLVQDYEKRILHFIKFKVEVIPDLKNRKKLSEEEQKIEEGKLILAKLKASDFLVLLDENGKEFNSVAYAKWMQKQLNKGLKNLVFVIGGPYGFSEAIYQASKSKIALSQMTFSHQMVRLFFTEQTYRAFSILNNLPYHHQ